MTALIILRIERLKFIDLEESINLISYNDHCYYCCYCDDYLRNLKVHRKSKQCIKNKEYYMSSFYPYLDLYKFTIRIKRSSSFLRNYEASLYFKYTIEQNNEMEQKILNLFLFHNNFLNDDDELILNNGIICGIKSYEKKYINIEKSYNEYIIFYDDYFNKLSCLYISYRDLIKNHYKIYKFEDRKIQRQLFDIEFEKWIDMKFPVINI